MGIGQFELVVEDASETQVAAGPARRSLLKFSVATSLAILAAPKLAHAQRATATRETMKDWDTFRERFVAPDGRVVDTGNNGISHSEGQGIGMLAAAHFGDRPTFDRMRAWTQETLRHSADNLHSWRYRPNAIRPVDDSNNATDGDLLIAFAMLYGATRWGDRSLSAEGVAIGRDVLRHLTAETPAGLVLLPGARGFTAAHCVTINPSYYIFPAIRRLNEEAPDPAWERLWESGLVLLRAARFGRWGLPPDWLELSLATAPLQPAQAWPARFSFDAVRVPLYLTWAGLGTSPVVGSVVRFWNEHPDSAVPAWTDLSANQLAPYNQPSGMIAVRRYVNATMAGHAPTLPPVAAASDYYAGALTLLARIASDRSPVIS